MERFTLGSRNGSRKWICPRRKKGLDVWNRMRCIRILVQKKLLLDMARIFLLFGLINILRCYEKYNAIL
jgi:hypothetical protein